MRTKVTLVLIFLNVALFFFIFKFERHWRTEAASQEARRRVLGPEAADIRSLTVTSSSAGASYSLVRRRDTWFLTSPLDWPANARSATSIAQELQLLEHETAFNVADLGRNNLSLADYGLDKPKLTVSFSSAEPPAAGSPPPPSVELLIGDATKDGKRLYILSPDRQRVHIVNRSLADALALPLDRLRDDTVISIRVFEARSLLIQTGGATGIRVRIRRDGTRWTFETPILATASRASIELAINGLNALRAKSFPSPAPSPAPSAAPSLRLTLQGNNRQETLFLGEPLAPPASPTAPVEYPAQLEGRPAIFTVLLPADLLKTLRNAQEDLREKRILDFDLASVTSIALAAPAQPRDIPITLQRLDPPAGQSPADAPPWQVVVRATDTQGPRTLPADPASVQRLLEQLSLASARVFKSDNPTGADLEAWGFNRPLREVTLSLSGNQPPVILRIGTDADRRAHYARVGTANEPGPSVFEISPDLERELPLAPGAWRHRAVTPPLPPTARIASLKLLDVETRQPRFEATLDASGQPTPAPRDPKALQQLVAWLRAVRAKDFLPGGFTEKIFAAGEERPWRLQLEATIALQPQGAAAEQTTTFTLLLSDRLGGAHQFAGSKELDAIFSLEQPIVDALWSLAYGPRDPGPPSEPKR